MPMDDLRALKPEAGIEVLEMYGIHAKANQFRTYLCLDGFRDAEFGEAKCYSQDDPKVSAFGFSGLADKVFAIEQDGEIVSACVSSRQNATCAEAWVFTHPDQWHREAGSKRGEGVGCGFEKSRYYPILFTYRGKQCFGQAGKKAGIEACIR